MISLKDKVALITGGSRGIGAATAILLAEAGADIAINYLNSEANARRVVDRIQALGRKSAAIRADVSDDAQAKELVQSVILKFGRLDILVNNAGIWTRAPIGLTDKSVWDATYLTNVQSYLSVTNAAVPHLMKSRGRIINITSTAGQRGEAFHSHYAASKGAITAFTKSIAVELGPQGILVNNVAPGWVDNDLNREVFSDAGFKKTVIESIPIRRIASSEDVAGAVLFLASDLSRHITGSTISVNGGAVLV
ncbi:3-oxoacyl-ACP reductase FabG [bacterium]|nr:3-oxoacyl-ACP reductase FabG [bacterium]NUN44216.1 3-oxoacyl-ACP reductase FabG [bacterium]HMW33069.1 3-oxoacyl-ACP reductase family protein [bacterium]HMW35997.1 3-oxoacyl-ACP reductase family protein [bacterium]HMY35059.1 3-oxoacyl-ACP reductase family protein [bacterium]